MNYAEAERLWATCRNKDAGKPLQNNTRLHKHGDDFAICLHYTDVVEIHPDGTYTIRSGGWQTPTTKDRITTYSPARVYSEGGSWYLRISPPGTYYWNAPIPYVGVGEPGRKEYLRQRREWDETYRVPFEDGMRIDGDGIPVRENTGPIKVKIAGVNAQGMPERGNKDEVPTPASTWYTPPIKED